MTPTDTDTPLGLDAVTEAPRSDPTTGIGLSGAEQAALRRDLYGFKPRAAARARYHPPAAAGFTRGEAAGRMREALADLEAQADRLRGWLSREERRT